MPTLNDPRELFLHELGDILYAERAIEKMLPKMARESTDGELRAGFQHHLEETRGQIENLERVFASLGEPPRAERCPGIEGLKAEHDEFMDEEEPTPELRDVFLSGAAARTEHYEIAAYTGLITMARALGEREAVDLLKENLQQEKATLKKAEALGRRLSRSAAKEAAAAA